MEKSVSEQRWVQENFGEKNLMLGLITVNSDDKKAVTGSCFPVESWILLETNSVTGLINGYTNKKQFILVSGEEIKESAYYLIQVNGKKQIWKHICNGTIRHWHV